MQEQVFLNEAAPARIDAVASDLSLSRKAILQEASYRYLEGLEWQAEIKAGRDDAAQGNIPPADDVERSFSARRSALRAGGLMVRAVWTAHAVRRREEIFDNIVADNADAACELDAAISQAAACGAAVSTPAGEAGGSASRMPRLSSIPKELSA